MQGGRFADGVEKDFVGVGMFEREPEVALDCVAERASAAQRSEQRSTSLQAQRFHVPEEEGATYEILG